MEAKLEALEIEYAEKDSATSRTLGRLCGETYVLNFGKVAPTAFMIEFDVNFRVIFGILNA